MRVGDLLVGVLVLIAIAAAFAALMRAVDPPPPVPLDPEPEETGARAPAPVEPARPLGPPPPTVRPAIRPPPTIHTCLSGRVLDLPRGLAAIGWIGVTVGGEEIRAPLDELGGFVIWNLPADRSHDLGLGFGPGSVALLLRAGLRLNRGERRKIEIRLGDASILAGVVTDGAGRPVKGARLALVAPGVDWRDPGTRVRTFSGREGRFVIVEQNGLVGREAKLVTEAVAQGYLVEERLVRFRRGGSQNHHVRLVMGKRIAGRVVGPKGKPIAGARVRMVEILDPDPTQEILPAIGLKTTDGRGRFEDDAFRPGDYRIFVRGRLGKRPFLVVLENVPAGRENLEIRFEGFGTLELGFRDARSGAEFPVRNGVLQRVYAHGPDDGERFEDWSAFTGRAEVSLSDLPAGCYRVHLSHPGYGTLLGDVFEVRAGRDAGPLTYSLKPRGR